MCPGYPNSPGGVTDHTARLVRHWSQGGREVLVLGAKTQRPDRVVAAWRQADVGAILIQYVPFLYGRRGLSRFPRQMAIAARSAGLRASVFVHEPWVPPTRLPWLVLSSFQRRQLKRLLRACDLAVTPVPAWNAMLGQNVLVAYVGNTLGEFDRRAPSGEELPAPVVFSPFASGLNWDWIVAAAQSVGARPSLTVIGANWETARDHPILKRWADPAWDWRGHLKASGVLGLLGRAKIVLAPFVDGLTGRRTSAFAAMSVGARLLSSRGPLYDPAFDAAPLAVARTRAEFCELARALFRSPDLPVQRRRRVEWHDRHMEPRQMDGRLLALVLGHPR